MDVDLCSFLVVPGLILLPSVLGGNRKLPKKNEKKNCFLNFQEALKNIYLHTTCIINLYGCFSDSFITMSGIRQGSASSVLLFILFMV